MRKLGVSELPQEVMQGVVSWVNEYGFRVTCWLYHSDPDKRGDWLATKAAGVPGGIQSDHIQQEDLVNPFLVRGKAIYWAFNAGRNVVDVLPCDMSEFRTWHWFLSGDFGSGGGATSWLFWAENPATNDLLIFDEVYIDSKTEDGRRTPEHIKPIIYERLRKWAGLGVDQPMDIRQVIKYATGDPSGLSYMQEYRKVPMPIYVTGGSPESKVKINDIEAGEARGNAYLSPSFVCCSTNDNPEGRWYFSRGLCPRCGTERIGKPRLTILRRGAPKLIEQLPTIRGKVSREADSEHPPPPGRVRVEDHSESAFRYGAMSRPVRKAPLLRPVETRESREATVATQFWERLQNHQEHARMVNEGEDFADGAPMGYPERREGHIVGGPW